MDTQCKRAHFRQHSFTVFQALEEATYRWRRFVDDRRAAERDAAVLVLQREWRGGGDRAFVRKVQPSLKRISGQGGAYRTQYTFQADL